MSESQGSVLEQLRRQPELILNALGKGIYAVFQDRWTNSHKTRQLSSGTLETVKISDIAC
jgi:hypothetical protein